MKKILLLIISSRIIFHVHFYELLQRIVIFNSKWSNLKLFCCFTPLYDKKYPVLLMRVDAICSYESTYWHWSVIRRLIGWRQVHMTKSGTNALCICTILMGYDEPADERLSVA